MSRKATESEVQMFSDSYKEVYGVRPRHQASLEEIADFFDAHYEEPSSVVFDDGSVHMVRLAKPWLRERWEEERRVSDEKREQYKWERAMESGDFSGLREEIEGYLTTESKQIVTLEF